MLTNPDVFLSERLTSEKGEGKTTLPAQTDEGSQHSFERVPTVRTAGVVMLAYAVPFQIFCGGRYTWRCGEVDLRAFRRMQRHDRDFKSGCQGRFEHGEEADCSYLNCQIDRKSRVFSIG
jgi:hypothetical protein